MEGVEKKGEEVVGEVEDEGEEEHMEKEEGEWVWRGGENQQYRNWWESRKKRETGDSIS